MSNTDTSPHHGILSLTIRDKSVLYAAYMPFVKNGGLFIPTHRTYRLGDEIFMLLNLMDEPERIPIAGKVVWITPEGAQGKKVQGIGVQFGSDEAGQSVKRKIEVILAGEPSGDRQTHTF